MERIALSVNEWFKDPAHIDEIEKLKKQGLRFEVEEKELKLDSDKLAGKTFIISGVYLKDQGKNLKILLS